MSYFDRRHFLRTAGLAFAPEQVAAQPLTQEQKLDDIASKEVLAAL